MEENKAKENKIENLPLKETEKSYTLENLPEDQADKIPRDAAGKIQVEAIATGKDDKGNYIFPDEIIERYYKELPNGSTNETGNKWVYNSGILIKANKEVQTAGGKALQAKLEQRRTFAEAITALLAQKASAQNIEELGLKENADNLDVVISSMLKQASRGNVKAADFLRDTIGQKPSEKLDASITGLSPEDKELLQNVSNRIGQQPQDID